jgi:cellulose 1,4-beta-cellobiosidase
MLPFKACLLGLAITLAGCSGGSGGGSVAAATSNQALQTENIAFTSSISGMQVTLNAVTSSGFPKDKTSYLWDLGDGQFRSGENIEYLYGQSGEYEVALTASHLDSKVTTIQHLTITALQNSESPNVGDNSNNTDDTSNPDTTNLPDDSNNNDDLNNSNETDDPINSDTTNNPDESNNDDDLNNSNNPDNTDDANNEPLQVHVSNPFLDADNYVNPDYGTLIDESISQVGNATLIEKMQVIKNVPTAIWLDRTEAIYGGSENGNRLSLEQHLDQALLQKRDSIPMTLSLVIYNLPDRDCAALASSGTLHTNQNGLQKYKNEYIDVIYNILSMDRFKDLTIVTTIEPDSLPNLVTNLSHAKCATVKNNQAYVQGIQYALATFSQSNNIYSYLDIAHSGWLGWEENLDETVNLYVQTIAEVDNGDMSVVDGFVTNTSNYTPLEEIYLADVNLDIDGDGIGVKSADFYGFNPVFDEQDFTQQLYTAFVAAGMPATTGFLIDTSRNGWGNSNRPTSQSSSSDENEYVNASRLDKRNHRGNWCNLQNAGMGERPKAQPYGSASHIDAFVWIKPPGESDGTSHTDQTIPDSEGKSHDPMCNPLFQPSPGIYTGAMESAPAAGVWFHEQFTMLVENAYPSILMGEDSNPNDSTQAEQPDPQADSDLDSESPNQSSGVLFSLDFEDVALESTPNDWENFIAWQANNPSNQQANGSHIFVKSDRAHSGQHSLYATTTGNEPAQIVKRLPDNLSSLYMRVWVYSSHTLGNASGDNHEHFLGVKGFKEASNDQSGFHADNEVRVGQGKGHLGFNHVPTDAISPVFDQWYSGPSTPANQWFCVETSMQVKAGHDELYMWVDGELVNSVQGSQDWHSPVGDDWLGEQMKYVMLGWHSFSSNSGQEFWFDDLVVSTEAIGCQ